MSNNLSSQACSGPRRILVVDDSKAQRMMLRQRLSRWGFSVTEAADGAEALERLAEERIALVLSDWVMPGLSGPELCQRIRESEDDNFCYFILLTSKSDKEDVSAGLTAGADDFLSKPVDEGEFRARLRAALRQIDMQENVRRKTDEISKAYTELKTLYEQIDKDLKVAASLQQAILPPAFGALNGIELAMYYRAAGHVGGDLVGYFPVDEDRIGVYGIDVSGHGVASSLLTIRLAQFFSASDPASNIAFRRGRSGSLALRAPAEVVCDLNKRFLTGDEHDLYFTIVYGVFEAKSGRFDFCQAGYSHPLIQRNDGKIEYAGEGGPPVGLLPGVDYATETVTLARGERLLLYSDGIVEAENDKGRMIAEKGLAELMRGLAATPHKELPATLMRAVQNRVGRTRFDDDVSMLSLCVPLED